MGAKKSLVYGLSITSVVVCLVGISAVLIRGEPASRYHVGVVDDWSFHHLVFSNPGAYEQVIAKGAYSKWINLQYDTRFILQQMKRSSGVKTLAEPGNAYVVMPARKPKGRLTSDWSAGLEAGNVQPNAYPAKYGASTTTASCTGDFVVYPTGRAGTNARASIVAYSNLYSGCGGTVPSVYWAYNTAETVSTSPIISSDDTQVAFVEVVGTAATLVLLKWKSNTTGRTVTGTVTAGSATFTLTAGALTANDVGVQISGTGIPAGDTIASVTSSTAGTLASNATASHAGETLTITAEAVATPGVAPTVTNANYRSCAAPCMTTLAFSGAHNDTLSAPFYDYIFDDALYVGDDSGNLHKFTGVFFGTPAEAASPWPVVLNATYKVTCPVYDPASGYVFVANTDGILYAVGTGTGTPATTSGSIHGTSAALGGAIIDGPLVDSSAGMVYVFVAQNSAGNNAVFQFNATFTSGTGNGAATGIPVGTGGAVNYLYDGAFDNVYFESATPTGNLYVVGGTGALAGGTLYRIPITNSVMGTPVAAVTGLNTTVRPWPSPLSEFCNNGTSACATNGTATTSGTDYVFFSINSGAESGCTAGAGNGCILSYNVSNPSAVAISGNGLNVTTPATNGCWATGGIVIDNSVPSGTLAGASQGYFINLNGNGAGGPLRGTYTSTGCTNADTSTINAVQASQASP